MMPRRAGLGVDTCDGSGADPATESATTNASARQRVRFMESLQWGIH